MITEPQLASLCGSKQRAAQFTTPLTSAMERYHINTPARVAMFLAQVMHESGRLRYVREIVSGDAYEGRRDLGNLQKGDGRRYKGRGLIQITGRINYRACSQALFGDERLLDEPEQLEQPEAAAQSAAWYWASRNLNHFADAGEMLTVTRRINGGTHGLDERIAYWDKAKKLLSETPA